MPRLGRNVVRGARRMPWQVIFTVGLAAAQRAREGWEDLTPYERRRAHDLVRKSKGIPSNLTRREREDLKRIAVRAAGFGSERR